MNNYDAIEQAFLNGYKKGKENQANKEEELFMKIERLFGIPCPCGAYHFSHHMYCPGCGKETEECGS